MDCKQVEGVIERIVFFNDENCYCIASMRPSSKKNGKDSITIAGIMPGLQCGETVVVSGDWKRHPLYGQQINVKEFESRLPSGIYGMEKFLGSGLIEGIGAGYAKKIVEKFGEDTLKIIDQDSARLREVRGIGAERVKKIKASWEEQRGLRDIMIALRAYGIGMAVCVRIMKTFGAEASEIVRTQPYKLAREVDGIGFKTADMIAINIGVPNESSERIQAGILHIVSENETEGNTCIPSGELIARSGAMLEVDTQKCAENLNLLLAAGDLKNLGDGILESASQDYSERRVALNLKRILKSPSDLPSIKFEAAVEWSKKRAGFEFATEQSEAILCALKNKISVITGGPGTGKTTILRAICDILKAKNTNIILAAPTGRAAQRMTESTGVDAKTIHRLLGYENGKFIHNEYKPLDGKFFIMDEASMLDSKLAAAFFSAVPDSAHLLLVGDTDQLPSVGAGNVLKDIIACGKFSVVRLNKIFRQGNRSQIVVAAHDILNGIDSMRGFEPCSLQFADSSKDINFILAQSPEDCIKNCVELISSKIPKWYGVDSISDVQLLAPMHKGSAGIGTFNATLKNALNPTRAGVNFAGSAYCVGDKIMQTRNNYDIDVFNGDMGRVVSVCADNSSIEVDFDGRRVILEKSDLVDFQQAYAISIHKSQGSEFPIVVMPLLRQHFVMLQRNLLYTGITRGRKKVFIIGDPTAFSAAVKNSRAAQRKTYLKQRLESLI